MNIETKKRRRKSNIIPISERMKQYPSGILSLFPVFISLEIFSTPGGCKNSGRFNYVHT